MNIDFDRLKYSLTGEYEEVMLEKQLEEKDKEIERLKIIEEKYKDSQLYIKDFKDEIERLNKRVEDLKIINEEHRELNGMLNKEIERLNKALLDIKELVVNNACLSEEDNRCVDDLIYYKCDELLDIVNKALGSDKE